MSTKPTPDPSIHSDSESEMDTEEPPQELKEISHTETDIVCKLCFRPAQDPEGTLKLGALYQFGYCVAHLYCLMFSSGLDQNGEDEEGINGFLPVDIVKEWRRGGKLNCVHCKKKYATVGCVGKGCKKSYHLSCGLENGSLQQFFGSFSSFCQSHRPVQAPLAKNKKNNLNNSINMTEECGVCLEELEEKPSNSVLWTPCCGGWFHRSCVERMAETAGCHFFKCPLCNNSKEFSEEMQQFGIYLPDQDAQWETGDAFDDQLQRHDRCDAEGCLCPSGPKYDEEDTIWEIMLCVCCGAQGIHIECGNLDLTRPRWKCGFCRAVVANLPNKPIPVFTRVKRSLDPPNKEFSRRVLENLSFNVTKDFEITIDMFKNRKNVKERAVATFQITGMPAVDIPNPVKVQKDVSEKLEDKIKNIPCPFDECTELVSRQGFKEHCNQHREGKENENETEKDEEILNINKNEKEQTVQITETIVEEILNINKNEKEQTVQIPETIVEEKNKNGKQNNEDSAPIEGFLEVVTPLKTLTSNKPMKSKTKANNTSKTPLSEPLSKKRRTDNSGSKLTNSGEKQSSILNFFQKFSPKVGSEKCSPKKQLKKVQACPGSPSLRSVKTPMKDVIMKTPEKKVISSPIGYFKVDEEISIKTPVKGFNERVGQVVDNKNVIVIADDHECDVCKEVFGDVTSLERHKSSHKTKFVCQFCKINFTNILSWKTHENSHRGASHNCPVCDDKFSSEKGLATHTKTRHMGREGDEKIGTPLKMFFCEICEYSSKYRGNIKKHTKIKHKENYDNASEISEKSVSESSEKSIIEASEKSVVVLRSPIEECVILDIDDDTDPETEEADLTEKNPKVETLLNDWD